MRAPITTLLVLPIWLSLGACDGGNSVKSDPKVVSVAEGDAAMEAAKAQGRQSLASFDAELASGRAKEGYDIKFDLDPGDGAEFIWGKVQGRNGDGYTATLANEPELDGFQLGQRVEVARKDVIDWGYQTNGVMQGHYTTRALIQQMPDAEAAQYRAALGW